MADPNWKRGFYYDDMPPHTGMKLARRESCGLEHIKKRPLHRLMPANLQKSRQLPTARGQNGSSDLLDEDETCRLGTTLTAGKNRNQRCRQDRFCAPIF